MEDGELVYDRERDTKPVEPTKPLYNGKVVCTDLCVSGNEELYTVGKVYVFKDGKLTADNGYKYPYSPYHYISSFDEWSKWTTAKFLELKE